MQQDDDACMHDFVFSKENTHSFQKFLIFLISKTRSKPTQKFSEKIDKILFEKLVKYRTLWHLACQQNNSKYLILRQGFN